MELAGDTSADTPRKPRILTPKSLSNPQSTQRPASNCFPFLPSIYRLCASGNTSTVVTNSGALHPVIDIRVCCESASRWTARHFHARSKHNARSNSVRMLRDMSLSDGQLSEPSHDLQEHANVLATYLQRSAAQHHRRSFTIQYTVCWCIVRSCDDITREPSLRRRFSRSGHRKRARTPLSRSLAPGRSLRSTLPGIC